MLIGREKERISTFRRATGTKKAVHLTMITTYGVQPGGYADDIQSQVTMDDLFQKATTLWSR